MHMLWSKKHTSTAICTIFMFIVVQPRVLLQPSGLKLAQGTWFRKVCAWVRGPIITWFTCQYTILVITAKAVQVCFRLNKFSNVTLNKGSNGRGWYCRSTSRYLKWIINKHSLSFYLKGCYKGSYMNSHTHAHSFGHTSLYNKNIIYCTSTITCCTAL